MTDVPPRYHEDRALRDAARAVVVADLERLRGSLEEQGVASRVTSSVGSTVSARLRAGADDVLEQARRAAGEHRGLLAALVGAILLWLMRGPLFALLEDDDDEADDGGADDVGASAPGDAAAGSADDHDDAMSGIIPPQPAEALGDPR